METYEKVLTKRKTWKMSQFKQAAGFKVKQFIRHRLVFVAGRSGANETKSCPTRPHPPP